MTEPEDGSVAVYIDFDNIVISREDQARKKNGVDPTVSLDAVLDFATKYGRVSISRAYADWSNERNASYRHQLVDRAVDLTQLFPASGTKNGADIRMAIDVVEDLYRHDDITHVVIVAGDSDYVPLAQRIRRLGREVIGIGVAGSISRALKSACDEYRDYDELAKKAAEDDEEIIEQDVQPAVAAAATGTGTGTGARQPATPESADPAESAESEESSTPRRRPGALLIRALRLLDEQHPGREWHALAAVKNQVLRMEPDFQEKTYEASSFGAFVKKYPGQVDIKDNKARLRPAKATAKQAAAS